MIRQFTTIPALLAGAAMIISACSAEVGGGGSDGSSSGSASSGSSVSSSQNLRFFKFLRIFQGDLVVYLEK